MSEYFAAIPTGRIFSLALKNSATAKPAKYTHGLSLRRAGEKVRSDDRVLGSSEFVGSVLFEAEDKVKETLRLNQKITDLKTLAGKICKETGIEESDLRSGSKMRPIAKARKVFARIAVKEMGYSGACFPQVH